MGYVIFHAVEFELPFDVLIRAAHSVMFGIPALDHKTADDPVKREPVIEVFVCQLDKVGNGYGRLIGVQLKVDRAVIPHIHLYLYLVFTFFAAG